MIKWAHGVEMKSSHCLTTFPRVHRSLCHSILMTYFVCAERRGDIHETMASGKKSALLSSLADYGDDSEPDDSDPEPEEMGRSRHIVVFVYDNKLQHCLLLADRTLELHVIAKLASS